MRYTIALLPFFVACIALPEGGGSEPVVAEDVESRLTDGYTCGTGSYTSFDDARTIRLQAYVGNAYTEPAPVQAAFDLSDPATNARLLLYTGTCLLTPGCTDDPDGGPGCTQEISQSFAGIEGVGELVQGVGDEMSGTVTGLVLEEASTGEILEIAELTLDTVPRWLEPTD